MVWSWSHSEIIIPNTHRGIPAVLQVNRDNVNVNALRNPTEPTPSCCLCQQDPKHLDVLHGFHGLGWLRHRDALLSHREEEIPCCVPEETVATTGRQ